MNILKKYKIKTVQRVIDLFGDLSYAPYNELCDKINLGADTRYLYINKEHCEPLKDVNIYIDERDHLVDK